MTSLTLGPVEDTKKYELKVQDATNSTVSGDSPTPALSPHQKDSNTGTLPAQGSGQPPDPARGRGSSLPRGYRLSNDLASSVETFHPHTVQCSSSSFPHQPSTSVQQDGGSTSLYDVPRKLSSQAMTVDDKYVDFYPKRPRSSSIGALPLPQTSSPDDDYYKSPSSLLATGLHSSAVRGNGTGTGPGSLYDVPKQALKRGQNSSSESEAGPAAFYDVPRSVLVSAGCYDVPPLSNRPRKLSEPTSKQDFVDANLDSGPNDVFETYNVPRQLMGQPVSSVSHYDVPRSLLSMRDEAPPNSRAGKLLRSNSSLSHGIYSVPRSTLAGQNHVQTTGPPVARKPSKQRKLVLSRSFDLSPVVETSPECNPHPNDVLYDVPPLDPDVLADRGAKTVALHNTDSSKQPSKFEQELKTVQLHKTHRQKKAETLPVSKKKKVPPPTKNKPRKSESKEHRR